jgi:hypothetical protein
MKDVAEFGLMIVLIIILILASNKGCSITINDKTYSAKIGVGK